MGKPFQLLIKNKNMKRTTFTLFLALLLGCFVSISAHGQDDGNKDIKVKLIDFEPDGLYDELTFKVKTKNDFIGTPVISTSICIEGVEFVEVFDITKTELSKRMTEYSLNLDNLEVCGNTLELKIRITVVDDSGNIINAGPGGIPNETIIIIEYP